MPLTALPAETRLLSHAVMHQRRKACRRVTAQSAAATQQVAARQLNPLHLSAQATGVTDGQGVGAPSS